MIKAIKDHKATVKSILIQRPECRDNDFLLTLKVWAIQNPELRNEETSFKSFGIMYKDGKYASFGTIRRARQLIQKEFPELEGTKKERRKEIYNEIKKNINK